MTRQFEARLLFEAEGLDRLSKLFQGFDDILAEFVEEYGDYLDTNLVTLLECVRYDVNMTLNGTVPMDNEKVPGILKQLEDVMDEVQTLQAGLPTKHGIPDEDCDETT